MFIWIVSPIILILQMVALISTIMFVIYLIKGGKYDDDDEARDHFFFLLSHLSYKNFSKNLSFAIYFGTLTIEVLRFK